MLSRIRTAVALVVFSLAAGGLAVDAQATTMLHLSLSDLYERSDVAVRGTIQSHISFWTDEGQLFTDFTIRVDEVLFGEAQSLLTFRQMGGELDGQRLAIDGDAQFVEGEQVVIFMVLDDGIYYLTALGQSKLSVSLQGDLGVPGGVLDLPSGRVGPVQATLVRELGDIVFYRHTDDGGSFYRVDDEILTLQDLRELSPSYDSAVQQGGE